MIFPAELAAQHPRVLAAITGSLVAASLWSLYRAVELHVATRLTVGDAQRAVSESLGG